MKFLPAKLFAIVFCLAFSSTTFAQNSSRISYSLVEKMKSSNKSDQIISVFVEGNIQEIQVKVQELGGVYKFAAGNIASLNIPLSKLEELLSLSSIKRIEDAPYPVETLNDKMIINNNVLPVHLGLAPLETSYDGSGVVIGFIDTGVDFEHPDFKDENGKTRIKYIWQQAENAANGNKPYGYGREWTSEDIDNGVAQHSTSTEFHGTHVAGIAAGNGLAVNNYKGVAPGADIISVAVNFSSLDFLSSIVDASHYIYSKAEAMGKPCVINASVGTYFGSHDGTDLPARLLNSIISAKPGRSFVCAAGNAGGNRYHLSPELNGDTSFTWLKRDEQSVAFKIYADTEDLNNISLAIGADYKGKNGFSFLGQSKFSKFNSPIASVVTDSVLNNGKVVGTFTRYTEIVDNHYEITLTAIGDSSGLFWRIISTGKGKFDIWDYNLVFDNIPSEVDYSDIRLYKMPDANQTIVSSFTCSPKVITVGNYVNRNKFTDVNGNIQKEDALIPGSLFSGSSWGPTRDGRIKPDIAASGTWVLSTYPVVEFSSAVLTAPYKVAAGGKHLRNTGTSMASPVVAGIAALYLQKNPNADYQEVKDAILNNAKRDNLTGTGLPNSAWGYGKADAFKTLSPPVGIQSHEGKAYIGIYPNPLTDKSFLEYNLDDVSNIKTLEFKVVDVLGKTVQMELLTEKSGIFEFNRGNMKEGVYFCNLLVNGKVFSVKKFVVL